MATILSSQQTFLPEIIPEVEDSHEHFRHFEFLIDALAQILMEIYQFQNLTYFVILRRHQWRHEWVKHNLHNYTSPTMYLQNIVCVEPVLHSEIVRTNIDTHTHKQTNKHTGWKDYHLANAGDNHAQNEVTLMSTKEYLCRHVV